MSRPVRLCCRADGETAKKHDSTQCLDDCERPTSTNGQGTESSGGQSVLPLRPAAVGAATSREEREGYTAFGTTDSADSREEPQQHGGQSPRGKFAPTTRVKTCVSRILLLVPQCTERTPCDGDEHRNAPFLRFSDLNAHSSG